MLVSFKGDKYLSCALVSDKEALVFTSPKTILVSFADQTQKILMYPEGIFSINQSLNITNKVPYFFAMTQEYDSRGFDKQLEMHIT